MKSHKIEYVCSIMKILNGNSLAATIKAEIALEVKELTKNGARPPRLAAILVGDDGASQTYVQNKIKSCEACGFKSDFHRLDIDTSEEILIEKIKELNNDINLDGYIVQLPLPKHIDADKINQLIHPEKDVDGFTPINFGKMALGLPSFIPATPFGILQLIERNEIVTEGKKVVVIGRSNIVGKPISLLLNRNDKTGNATVIMTHSKTKNLELLTRDADIIVCALGVPDFVKGDMIKEGAVLIDVGITRVVDTNHPKGYVIKGDIDFESVKNKCSYITPVPGGVGPMTVTMLMKNTLESYKKKFIPTYGNNS